MRKVSLLAEAAALLGLVLLGFLVVGQWLNIGRHLMAADSTTACADNLNRLGLAVTQYAQDNDELLPPMQNAQAFKTAVLPDAGDPKVFNCPDTGLPYTPNAAISQQSIPSLGNDYDTIEVARDPQPHEDGLYTVVFLDGTVQHGGQVVGDPNTIAVSRAKQLGLAVTQYEQDYDENLPPMHNPQEFKTAVFPYAKSHLLFNSPNGQPFVPNVALSGASLASISDPATTVLFQDTLPYVGGAPTIAYVDDHVTHTGAANTHVLWKNVDGRLSLWNYNTNGGTFSQNSYGPYAGWSAKAIAEGGTDGKTRVLWVNTDGRISLWSLDNAAGSFSQFTFGPYTNWTAKEISVSKDNTTHILWANTNGAASLWNYSTTTGSFTQNTYGPYAGWTATAIADGPDSKTRVLWDNSSGAMSLWSLDNTSGAFTQYTFGPYTNWTANAVSVDTGNTTNVLWTNTSGVASLWNYSTTDGTFTQNTYGPYAGWNAASIADGPDGRTRVLWDNTNGAMSLWSLDNGAGAFTQFTFGPFSGWTASAVSAGP